MADIDELLTREAPLWRAAVQRADGPRVLLATSMGGFNHGAVTDKALALALTLRGARVEVFLCDGVAGCHLTKIGKEPPVQVMASDQRLRCASCVKLGEEAFAPLGLKVWRLSELLTAEDRAEAEGMAAAADSRTLKSLRLNGWKVGEHALAGALRYFARGDLAKEPQGDAVARKFLKAAVMTARGFDRLLAQRTFDVVSANHGIYVPQGVVGEVARARGVRVVNWNPAYRRHCFVFSHGDTYHHTMISEDVGSWRDLKLTPERLQTITGYLRDRREAKGDWIWFNKSADAPRQALAAELGLDDRPLIVALTSVVWDACLHYESNAFESLTDWMLQTVDYFKGRPDLQLVIRVHPAEVTGFVKSRDRMVKAIAKRFGKLPENIKVVPPESELSTYSLLDHANAVLLYSTKTGIEASAQGLPVVVAGEAWIRGKGFSRDATSPEGYRTILDTLPFQSRLSEAERESALRYAYHFFFRRMIELPFLADAGPAAFEIRLESLEELMPGRHPGLDRICDGILSGAPFVYDALDDDGPVAAWAPPRPGLFRGLAAAAGWLRR